MHKHPLAWLQVWNRRHFRDSRACRHGASRGSYGVQVVARKRVVSDKCLGLREQRHIHIEWLNMKDATVRNSVCLQLGLCCSSAHHRDRELIRDRYVFEQLRVRMARKMDISVHFKNSLRAHAALPNAEVQWHGTASQSANRTHRLALFGLSGAKDNSV